MVSAMQLETVSGEMEELELEAHHILLNDKWRQLFDKFDNEGFGEIPWDDFLVALESPDFQECIEPSKREVLASKAREHRTYAITFDDFVAVVSTFFLPFTFYTINVDLLYNFEFFHESSIVGKRWCNDCIR
ncbi:uncharacterized protein CDAR_314761 [Caerostris darwini]|uniref:Uncharacterized protein n=1 Tax=Caerostris darwini TaxID=1538125 RepID=A0AAV4TRT0_9ARAC|nr:uncharacterized protein CDAR_314761 [Caerostris darwini]